MDHDGLTSLADAIESDATSDPEVVAQILHVLREIQADVPKGEGLDETVLTSSDAALGLVCSVLPGWEIRMQGNAVSGGGNWTCSLRQGSGRDDDEVIGIGKAQSPAKSVVAALLMVAARRKRGYV